MRFRLRTLMIVLAVSGSFRAAMSVNAAETGHLKMRFICNGEPPPQNTLNVDGLGGATADGSLIINKANHGIQNVCVWLLRTPGDLFSVDDGKHSEQQKRVMTLTGGNFSPRIEILRTPQSVVIRNDDQRGYNITSDGWANNRPFSELLKPGDSIEKRVEFREWYPVRLSSSIHPWVAGYILALDQPHAAISDADGQLTIRDIPIGKWAFVVWHERSGVVKKAIHAGQPIEWPDGLMSCTIKPGENGLGEFALPLEQLRLK
jgi:hypothetical protein